LGVYGHTDHPGPFKGGKKVKVEDEDKARIRTKAKSKTSRGKSA
jgi:hypothetical protein